MILLRTTIHENHILIKLHIWFWSKLVITLTRVRPFFPMTNANTNSVRAGQISFSENNFLQLRRPLVSIYESWELYNLRSEPSSKLPNSAVCLFSIITVPVECPLIFNFWLGQIRAKTSYWNIQVFLDWLILLGLSVGEWLFLIIRLSDVLFTRLSISHSL